MGNLWDAFVEGYGSDPLDHLNRSDPVTAPVPASGTQSSAWGKLIDSYQSTGGETRQSEWKAEGRGGGKGKVSAQYVIDGLVKRGLPKHIAEGFAMNIEDESGFRPGINEAAPIVPGSRGGYGLYQLTGPRRRQYEALVAQKGGALDDPDLQMDFLVQELETTEKRAAGLIYNSTNSGQAGDAIVRHFLRPAESHREHRSAKYLGGSRPTYAETAAAPEPPQPNRLWLDLSS